ncbi:MAG TPA: hypothetical protein VHI52_16670 [Verrucomicrobiae bacterium]|nr:hypothetical protein [Verrucomicrobiae bacterium]
MARWFFLIVLALANLKLRAAESVPLPGIFFGIEVLDDTTQRGVPMVQLQTTSGVRYYTDSAGMVAFYEPGLMNRKVWFEISSPGYEFAKDGFGLRGVSLQTTPGTVSRLKIKRLNIAERLYRITGEGVYRDSMLLGRKAPVAEPLLNGGVTGQDGILTAVYRGKLYWFYGDTSRLSYGLGNFAMSGATTELPDRIDPSVGVNLRYFVGEDGFSRPMAPMKGEGVVWLSGLLVLPDESGEERMIAWYQRRRGLGAVLENGFVEYNDQKNVFEKLKTVPTEPALVPQGYPFRGTNDPDHIYFTTPYPALRVRAEWRSCLELDSYEGFTCLKPGGRYSSKDPVPLERDSAGKLIWAWKRDTPPLKPQEQEELIKAGQIKREECPFRLEDPDTGAPILINSSSCFWNNYRKRYVMIACQVMGATVLGEIWYSEATAPEGPWVHARKIITHAGRKDDAHDFYNPTQHPFFDREGGRVIYLEGSYVNTFSGNPAPTPYYEYNQIMYRLDLSDPRLK